jgi:hypothetical protein
MEKKINHGKMNTIHAGVEEKLREEENVDRGRTRGKLKLALKTASASDQTNGASKTKMNERVCDA